MKKFLKKLWEVFEAWHLKHHKCKNWQVNYSQTWHVSSSGFRSFIGSEVKCTICGKIEPGSLGRKAFEKEGY